MSGPPAIGVMLYRWQPYSSAAVEGGNVEILAEGTFANSVGFQFGPMSDRNSGELLLPHGERFPAKCTPVPLGLKCPIPSERIEPLPWISDVITTLDVFTAHALEPAARIDVHIQAKPPGWYAGVAIALGFLSVTLAAYLPRSQMTRRLKELRSSALVERKRFMDFLRKQGASDTRSYPSAVLDAVVQNISVHAKEFGDCTSNEDLDGAETAISKLQTAVTQTLDAGEEARKQRNRIRDDRTELERRVDAVLPRLVEAKASPQVMRERETLWNIASMLDGSETVWNRFLAASSVQDATAALMAIEVWFDAASKSLKSLEARYNISPLKRPRMERPRLLKRLSAQITGNAEPTPPREPQARVGGFGPLRVPRERVENCLAQFEAASAGISSPIVSAIGWGLVGAVIVGALELMSAQVSHFGSTSLGPFIPLVAGLTIGSERIRSLLQTQTKKSAGK